MTGGVTGNLGGSTFGGVGGTTGGAGAFGSILGGSTFGFGSGTGHYAQWARGANRIVGACPTCQRHFLQLRFGSNGRIGRGTGTSFDRARSSGRSRVRRPVFCRGHAPCIDHRARRWRSHWHTSSARHHGPHQWTHLKHSTPGHRIFHRRTRYHPRPRLGGNTERKQQWLR